ncbi:TPA: hypothetical protein I7703_19440 [Vibrio vulnificus]|nr:hypothetical protein D8T38_21455 [Vibrio vulnificus]HAS8091230.1 hypothetical protein [Vibrio vulnificus]HAS8325096.1 hypothetical protein [Vibrio vulnificus]HAS8344216.1 hypothetical protein [Vibrio vulnificus]HAS8411538.1 hypothetical protein [Vibrio vulnificus]
MRMRFFYNTIWLGSVTEIRLFSRATVHVCLVKKRILGSALARGIRGKNNFNNGVTYCDLALYTGQIVINNRLRKGALSTLAMGTVMGRLTQI